MYRWTIIFVSSDSWTFCAFWRQIYLSLLVFCFMSTIQANSESFVVKTLDRKTLWEMQTPQVRNSFFWTIREILTCNWSNYLCRLSSRTCLRKALNLLIGDCFFILSGLIPNFTLFFLDSRDLCREGLEVTDDVSIVEHLKHPVYITEGSYTNIKVVKQKFPRNLSTCHLQYCVLCLSFNWSSLHVIHTRRGN